MTDRPDDATPTGRRAPAVPGSAVPSREAPAPSADAAERPAAPLIDSALVGKGGDRPAMARRTAAVRPVSGGTDRIVAGNRVEGSSGDPTSAALARPDVVAAGMSEPVTGDAANPPFSTGAGATAGDGAGPAPKSGTAAGSPETSSGIPAVAHGDKERGPNAPAPAARPAEPPAPVQRRGGFAPLFLGGVVAAALGAGAAYWAVPRLPPAWQPSAPAPATDTAALSEAAAEAARAEIERQAGVVESRAIEAARQAAADAATQAAGASLSAQGETLIDQARQAGADAAAQLLAEAPAGPGPDPSLQTTLAAQARQLAALDQALAELREAPGQTIDLSPVQQGIETQAARIDALEQALSAQPAGDPGALDSALQAQAGRIEALEQAVAALRDSPPVDLAPIQARLDELAQRPVVDTEAVERLNTLAADVVAATQRIGMVAEQAEARLAEVESRAATLADTADEAARRAQAAAAAAAIGEALQTGAPRDAALSQLAEAGVTPPPALMVEVPTLDELVAGFPPAARAALRDALQAETVQGQGSFLGNFLRAQTGARSVAPREGDDADAVLSRAGAAVERGEIRAALAELAALPEPARPAMAEWTAQAQAYADAHSAVEALVAPEPAAPAAGQEEASAQPEPAEDEPAAEPAGADAPAQAEDAPDLRPTPPVITTTVPLGQPAPPPADAGAAAPSN
ncbi:COG4223 family protein [Paracoccus sp. MC1862]|uniref:COG4223 family protein n=1 Tax=Paracoccus sp. MC1862 TaxID=2760307 RepID=UPI0015FEEA6E|nr:hypothetical protein [Paracoccus sp. MC1862]MBB1497426.1 hypothetical protein [Paracoccus sp. MC1862]QQO45912.1 hypothetical protein JGR78_06330 [Paracoccus sp. MC1862]